MGAVRRAVVVTGGGSGIGRATAEAFAEAGDRVLVVGRSAAALEATAAASERIRVLVADLRDEGAPRAVVGAALSAFGRLDVLVNNAAQQRFGALGTLDRAAVAAQLETNLLAPLFLVREALDALEACGGTVVNVGSAGSLGRRAWPHNAVYGLSKAALDFLTRTWAVELAPRGIRCVGVAPGVVDTGFAVRSGMPEEGYEEFLASVAGHVPCRRVGGARDIAWWIVRLCRAEGAYANGVVQAVDGGLSVT
ncbi:SDR family NAD(P)-dependent oxidoreductase [Streptomyces sp. NPDC002328]|uniref:SDR family NAD(P)-dependent oxidoreductase n=1 Tax=Streptomyces sp. NPDC002328 TaxID=3364642 RepID=UPI0036AE71A1